MNDIYKKIGEIIQMVQYIEYNVADYLGVEHNRTTGQIAKEAIEKDLFNEEQAKRFELIVEKRNNLVHQYFKENDFENINDDFLEKQHEYLRKFLTLVEQFNRHVINITN